MVTLLVDADLDGHARLLDLRLGIESWRELREHVGIQFLHLEQVGLDRSSKDNVVWRLCQQKGYYLLTANRNLKSEDSLEATIRREGTAECTPVFTVSDEARMYKSTPYLDEIVESLLDYLLRIDELRGTGRLYLP